MNLGEFRKQTKHLSDETEMIVQKDAEGNGYSPLEEFGLGFYVPTFKWCGDVYPAVLEDDEDLDEHCLTQEMWDDISSNKLSIILVPVN